MTLLVQTLGGEFEALLALDNELKKEAPTRPHWTILESSSGLGRNAGWSIDQVITPMVYIY